MAKKLKELKMCKIAKKELIEDDFPEYARLVKKPRYACLSCGRVAKSKKQLCDPRKLSD